MEKKKRQLTITGKWQNSDNVKVNIVATPDRSDDYSIDLTINNINSFEIVHISREKENKFYAMANDIIGTGNITVKSVNEIYFKTSKLNGITLFRDFSKI